MGTVVSALLNEAEDVPRERERLYRAIDESDSIRQASPILLHRINGKSPCQGIKSTCFVCKTWLAMGKRCLVMDEETLLVCSRCYDTCRVRWIMPRLCMLKRCIANDDLQRHILLLLINVSLAGHATFYGYEMVLTHVGAVAGGTVARECNLSEEAFSLILCDERSMTSRGLSRLYTLMNDGPGTSLRGRILSFWLNEYRCVFLACPDCPLPDACAPPFSDDARVQFIWYVKWGSVAMSVSVDVDAPVHLHTYDASQEETHAETDATMALGMVRVEDYVTED